MTWRASPELQSLADAFRERRLSEYRGALEAARGADFAAAIALAVTAPARLIDEEIRRRGQCLDGLATDLMGTLREQNALTVESGGWVRDQVMDLRWATDEPWANRGMFALAPGLAPSYGPQLDRGIERAIKSIESEIRISVGKQVLAANPVGGVEAKSTGRAVTIPVPDQRDEKIIAALHAKVPGAAASYEQAVRDLASERLSWRGPAAELREALHDVLDALGPADRVRAQAGFRAEGKSGQASMRQQAHYIFTQRRATEGVEESVKNAVGVSEELFARFVRSVHVRGSESVHEAAGRADAVRLYDLVRLALEDLLGIGVGITEAVTVGHRTGAASGIQEAVGGSESHESS